MKKISIYLVALVLTLSACKDFTEMNIDPNRPTETHPQLLLTSIEWTAFQQFGGTGPLYAQKMLVQTDGENTAQYYKWDRGSFGPYSSLRDVTKMMEEAVRINDNSYVALGKFFRAYYFYNLAVTFGDIPYSQALQGETQAEYSPAQYDNQKAVFVGVLKELEEANTLLKNENNIIAGDIIYQGDVTKWRKLVNSFRLKVLMSLSKKEADADLNIKSAFAQIAQNEPLLASAADDGQLVFLDQQGNRYPEFNSSSFGSGMYIDSTFIRRLQDREDPRLFIYCTQTKLASEAGKDLTDFTAYEGGDPAVPYAQVNIKATAGKTSKVNDRYHKDPTTEPRVILGYSELQFILAEGVVRGWITGDAAAYYNKGVKASFKFYETYTKGSMPAYVSEDKATEYLTKPLNDLALATTTEAKIERIAMQKYLRSFFQSGWDSYFNTLRTGYPDYRRPSGVSLPYRWIYPQAEYNNNRENVSEAIKSQFGEGKDLINEKTWWLQ
ncbi:SusD-like starch-binding protein associating with outer membrane [Dyadobacter jejuensis]|uniref:SusD-like starch-binding protein associating with outer membrane n=1 Tax=Dyadobacter jejuensis TaxID=1082580 RepID=A0A316AQB2_9BACT|nr:SusD/RagB family nutrient-binding outer membrane lipoprotein [Dyadobacter jejuensis]PWJ59449.1 SusD-like starch-binding protein associating with outer membrane [Dyadobacter jejuensis]